MTRRALQAAALHHEKLQPTTKARAGVDIYQPATVLFVDMIGFTAFCAKNDPATVSTVLQELLSLLSEKVLRHGGVVEKFLGDGLMAFFDGSGCRSLDAAKAVSCAIAMTRSVSRWNDAAGRRDEKEIRIAIGIHSGSVIIAPVGGAILCEMAVFGDTVNIASRVEGKCRCLDAAVLVTAQVIEKVRAEAMADCLDGFASFGFHELRGRTGYVHLHGIPRRPLMPAIR